MNLLLQTLKDFLSNPQKLIGIIVAAIGFAFVLLAKRIAKAVRHSKTVPNDDKVYLCILGFALLTLLTGLIISIL